ncbi:MAG: hypothetical protein ABDH23_07130 [Endomicrobiia bacterium]
MELKKEVKTIHVFLTPLAAFLIICAVLISNADTILAGIGLLIVLFTIVFNNVTAMLKTSSLAILVLIRVVVNLLLNLVLVYMFIPFWTPIWLLLMLSCLGTAVYSDFLRTFFVSLISSIGLILIFYMRVVPYLVSADTKLIRVGEIVNYALFIVVVSILVNGIIRKYKSFFN